MKFTIERAPLAAAVKRASAVIKPRNVVPALDHVHIVAADNALRITGTDMVQWVTASCTAAVTEPGSICLNAMQINAWLAAIPKGALVTLDLQDTRAVMTAGGAKASFATLPTESYPVPAMKTEGVEVIGAIPHLTTCLPYASTEESRRYLCGVSISSGHIVATDGQKLCAIAGAPDGLVATIPSEAIRTIMASGPSARLYVGDNTWSVEDQDACMGGQLLGELFPDWNAIVPRDAKRVAVMDADALADAVGMVSMASDAKTRAIKIIATDGTVSLACEGSGMTATATVQYEGDDFMMGINAKHADAALATFSGRVINLAETGNGILITCDAAPDMRVLVMGMRV